MSTEKLTAKEILERWFIFNDSGVEHCVLHAMEEYAAQQVEQQTKQLKEGREDFHDLLIQLVECLDNGYAIKKGSPIHQEATRLLNQLNQQNEG